jgi:hypothetical protein
MVRLSANNDYTGGTWINGCTVIPLVNGAFSSGAVVVGNGECRGGRVLLSEPIELSNNFVIGGSGVGSGDNTSGCIVFEADSTLTGTVTVDEDAHIGVAKGVTGTIAGKITGGRIIAKGGGTLHLTADNDHAKGSEVFASTLSVDSTAALGSGEVVLNGGTIRFGNAQAEILANSLRGIGVVQMAGAEVKFTGDKNRLNKATVLDFPGSQLTLSEQPPFENITNSTRRTAKIVLSGSDYSFDPAKLGGRFDLTLAEGATLDLGGGTLKVRNFTGNPSAVNGTIVNDSPGVMIIVR